METHPERRRSPRFKVGIPVRYRKLDEGPVSPGVGTLTHDVSGQGLRFKTKEAIAPAEQLVLELDVPGQPVQAVTKVAWVKASAGENGFYEVGGQFMEITQKDQEFITSYLQGRKGL